MDAYDRIVRVSPRTAGGMYWDPFLMRDPWQNSGSGMPVPYYQAYGQIPDYYMRAQEDERDLERMKEMYPDVAKEIAGYVEEMCDGMEYEGSMMFDESPDRLMMQKLAKTIYDKMKDRYPFEEEEQEKDETLAMNQDLRRRRPPRKNWLNDLIQVMLFQEMHRRRCRRRDCRRWY